jgi:hypothetical protein
MRRETGESWTELGLVFCTRQGSALDAANVRRSFRLVGSAAGLNPKEWTRASYGTVSCPCYQAQGDDSGDRTLRRPWKYKRHRARVPEGTARQHTRGARHQPALRWRRQAIGRSRTEPDSCQVFHTSQSIGLSEQAVMDALCEDGLLPSSERDDLVQVFRESFGLSEAEVLRSPQCPLAYGCRGGSALAVSQPVLAARTAQPKMPVSTSPVRRYVGLLILMRNSMIVGPTFASKAVAVGWRRARYKWPNGKAS